MNYEKEYASLRNEIDSNKKYVFERPFLIITVGLALSKFELNSVLIYYLPILIILLLIFNFWFTFNRLYSSARIIAYIQLIIEKEYQPYQGWENFLMFYRKFIKQFDKKDIEKIIKIELDKDYIASNYGFYPIIYYFHLVAVLVSFLVGLYVFIQNSQSYISFIFVILLFSATIYMVILCIKHNIYKLRRRIVYERTLIQLMLEYQNNTNMVEIIKQKYNLKK